MANQITLKEKLVGLLIGLDVNCERKTRVKSNSRIFWAWAPKNGIAIFFKIEEWEGGEDLKIDVLSLRCLLDI